MELQSQWKILFWELFKDVKHHLGLFTLMGRK